MLSLTEKKYNIRTEINLNPFYIKFGVDFTFESTASKNYFVCSVGEFIGLDSSRFVTEEGIGCNTTLFIEYINTVKMSRRLERDLSVKND